MKINIVYFYINISNTITAQTIHVHVPHTNKLSLV